MAQDRSTEIIPMIEWIRSSRFLIKNLSVSPYLSSSKVMRVINFIQKQMDV